MTAAIGGILTFVFGVAVGWYLHVLDERERMARSRAPK